MATDIARRKINPALCASITGAIGVAIAALYAKDVWATGLALGMTAAGIGYTVAAWRNGRLALGAEAKSIVTTAGVIVLAVLLTAWLLHDLGLFPGTYRVTQGSGRDAVIWQHDSGTGDVRACLATQTRQDGTFGVYCTPWAAGR